MTWNHDDVQHVIVQDLDSKGKILALILDNHDEERELDPTGFATATWIEMTVPLEEGNDNLTDPVQRTNVRNPWVTASANDSKNDEMKTFKLLT